MTSDAIGRLECDAIWRRRMSFIAITNQMCEHVTPSLLGRRAVARSGCRKLGIRFDEQSSDGILESPRNRTTRITVDRMTHTRRDILLFWIIPAKSSDTPNSNTILLRISYTAPSSQDCTTLLAPCVGVALRWANEQALLGIKTVELLTILSVFLEQTRTHDYKHTNT